MEKPTLQTTLAKLASIVPTPMGLNDSPRGSGLKMDQRTLIPVARDYLVGRVTTHQG